MVPPSHVVPPGLGVRQGLPVPPARQGAVPRGVYLPGLVGLADDVSQEDPILRVHVRQVIDCDLWFQDHYSPKGGKLLQGLEEQIQVSKDIEIEEISKKSHLEHSPRVVRVRSPLPGDYGGHGVYVEVGDPYTSPAGELWGVLGGGGVVFRFGDHGNR